MVKLKPKNKQEPEISIVNRRGFRFKHLLLFILGSTLVHGLIFLLLVKYEATKLPVEETESEPIEFVVVPPEEETEEPPPETNNRAMENSVAQSDIQPEPASTPESNELIPAPAPEPEPTPEPEVAAEPEFEPEPEPESIPEPEPPANETISGSDAPIVPPEPVEEPVATRSPPEPESSTSDGSAADLLGGDYQKTLANSGDAFFSPEALTHETVLNAGQIDALRNVDLSAYFGEMKQRVKRNWNPSYSSQEQTTYLTFNVQKNGQITGLKITKSSGSSTLDQESLEAVQKSAPFPPLPPDFPLEALEIEFSFNIYLYE